MNNEDTLQDVECLGRPDLLAKLIERLSEEDVEDHFNLEVFICGTERCAMGWAATIAEVQQRGISLKTWADPAYYILVPIWYGKRMNILKSGQLVFEITNDQSLHLFSDDEYVCPDDKEECIRRIFNLIGKYKDIRNRYHVFKTLRDMPIMNVYAKCLN